MSPVLRLARFLSLGLASLVAAPTANADPVRPQQVVIISFDGAHDLEQWQRSRRLAAVTGARFTYFLSCVFLLTTETKRLYGPPGMKAGRSNVGFAPSVEDVGRRLRQIWLARAEGHDIASHGCGHFDGSKWSKADWRREFAAFSTILRDAWRINGLRDEPPGWRSFAESEVQGFRAPYLATGKALLPALVAAGFRYDASGVSPAPAAPQAAKAGLVTFALPQIPFGPSGRRVIAMDYNMFVRNSGGIERTDADGRFEDQALDAFHAAFEAEYSGERLPLQMGFHFTLMNGGAYWRALERFAHDVCLRPDVACISHADYVARMGSPASAGADPVGG